VADSGFGKETPVSSVNWNNMSLSQLKDVVAHIGGGMFGQLRNSATHFQQAATALETAESDLSTQMGVLRDGWQGKAASAAVNNAQQNRATMNQTRSSSTSAGSDTDGYLSRLESDQKQANAIQNVDTSLGHALLTGGWAGPVGVGVAAIQAHQQYNKNHDAMVKIVQQMDTDGQNHADQMKSMDWSNQMNSGMGAPPATLPPVPGSSAPKGSGSSPGGYPGGGTTSGGSGPGYTPVMTGPAMSGADNNVINGPRGNHPGAGDPTETQSGPSPKPNDPTVSQSGPGSVSTPGTGTGPTVGAAPTTGSAVTGAGAVGGVIGGAGLIGGATGGGLLGGTGTRGGSLAEGEGSGRLPRSGSGIAEGEGEPRLGGVRGGGAPGEGALGEPGEPGVGVRGPGGIGGTDPEPVARGGVRPGANGALGDGELGAPRGSALAGARPTGFAGEPVAAEAGRMGGYPMGGLGGRRGGDDEEAPMPDYLVETDDVWGDGVTAAPPVIGE
jgi:uncharacterized protein YukE